MRHRSARWPQRCGAARAWRIQSGVCLARSMAPVSTSACCLRVRESKDGHRVITEDGLSIVEILDRELAQAVSCPR
jgi:hypothetical protein